MPPGNIAMYNDAQDFQNFRTLIRELINVNIAGLANRIT